MPKLISECGDILLWDFSINHVGVMPGPGRLTLHWRVQVSLIGVLKVLSGTFMPGQVVFFSMVLGAATMGVGSQVTVLSRYLL